MDSSDAPLVQIINGPNLNLLGVREPEIYGTETLGDIETACAERAEQLGLDIDFRQSNLEGDIVDWIQEARLSHDGIILNAAAYTHTSVAILDALKVAELPVIELHMSNPHRREAFRHTSYVSLAADGMICGLGSHGYLLALDAIARLIELRRQGSES
ncbi:MAG: type II 3-dehydroquinate dehydratase [Rhodospirillaceae bacterium]|nr:type II 3-dehydroquinate dehydratase [Rhodospirillaceae bacterium]